MIEVTRLNGDDMVVNGELIETIEATPDTMLSLTTGKKVLVREPVMVVVQRVLAYRRLVYGALPIHDVQEPVVAHGGDDRP